ncbi:hypothetical protein [Streptomyces rishiriensis]|uniref:hypothetical protein n=1 Tax=Streptomyces rishiriensis TaxID=68264 RepID=UPI0037D635EB
MVKQIAKAGLQLTQRGLGPWARIYREPEGSKRHCVQLCIRPWNALDTWEWGKTDDPQLLLTMHPADLARYLGLYAARVMTPRGSTATTGLEVLVALRPPTRGEGPGHRRGRVSHPTREPARLSRKVPARRRPNRTRGAWPFLVLPRRPGSAAQGVTGGAVEGAVQAASGAPWWALSASAVLG